MRRLTLVVMFVLSVLLISGCNPTTAQKEIAQQDVGVEALLRNQPVPNLGGWSLEREIVTKMLIARNEGFATYTYLYVEMTGELIYVCDSWGAPIPYSTQLTNPTRVSYTGQGGTTIGNPEPNGLYSAESAAATWVACITGDGNIFPFYSEPDVISSPIPIAAQRSLEFTDVPPSMIIKVNR